VSTAGRREKSHQSGAALPGRRDGTPQHIDISGPGHLVGRPSTFPRFYVGGIYVVKKYAKNRVIPK
jgi:hypothetical protein